MITSTDGGAAPLDASGAALGAAPQDASARGQGLDRESRPSRTTEWIVAIFLLILRIPYILIHHIQEDAFITFRTARHLAEHGDLSFNLGQHVPATTSLLYPILLAALDQVFGERAILGIQLLGSFATIAASYCVARAFARDGKERLVLWLLLGSWPVSLLAGYTGMEIPFLLLLLGMAILALRSGTQPWLFWVALFLMPLVRPDAIAYALIFSAAMFVLHRRQALLGILALGCGLALSALGYRWFSGSYLPTTMSAKLNAYAPSHAVSVVLQRIAVVVLGHSFLLPVSTNYLNRLSPIVVLLFVVSLYAALRYAGSRPERVAVAAIATLAIVVPLAYAWGGVLFDWYLYPPNWLGAIVVLVGCSHAVRHLRFRSAAVATAAVLWVGFAAVQWAHSLAASTQDFHYRGDIGRYLHDVSGGQGTLFLEPAGFIPYYAGLPTFDEVGLVSPEVSRYIRQDRHHWWIHFVEAQQPTYIVQRESFVHFQTFDGETLSADEQRWFLSHYELIRRTHYNPALYHPSPILRRILQMGPMPDYLIYQRKTDAFRSLR